MRVPGARCFSTTSVGELKNKIESRSALSTKAAAIARTPRLAPIKTRPRCLRVPPRSAFKPQAFDHIFDLAKLIGIFGERPLGVGCGSMRLIVLTQHHIGA